ncbi:ABC transporter ATP-binding protein [Acidimangrovimonas sediminis]|uniref:ABC transporter ATP-binding protein n=1 Tax=Acidimangrovimonas sediminis TaxID=2056283 RepID=UPI001E3B2EFC|nr:ABC transporter ATP-binding protein [Acidimangrovimonas sediminis]
MTDMTEARPAPQTASGPSAEPTLRVRGLTTVFRIGRREMPAIENVDLEIAPGETLALVGESGSGKSITSLSVLRLLPGAISRIGGGEVSFRDREGRVRDLVSAGGEEMRRLRGNHIGTVFQEPMSCLNPVHRIGDQIAEPLILHLGLSRRAAFERVVELLAAMGIPDPARRARQYPHELSGGMSQRATIAMALACDPVLLIADEPTTALDVTTQAQILRLLQDLQKTHGMAMLFVTHNFGVVAEIAHRVAVMYAGHVVEQGRVADVFRHPRHPYTRGLMTCVPQPGDALALRRAGQALPTIQGSVPSITDRPPGCPFAPRCALAVDACRAAVPAMEDTGDGHLSRCIRWSEM